MASEPRQPRHGRASLWLALAAVAAPAISAQSVVERTPNLEGGWVGATGRIYFTVVHRFEVSGGTVKNVLNSPTLFAGTGLFNVGLVGVKYASKSLVAPGEINEWELLGRFRLLEQQRDSPLDVAFQGAYNVNTESLDGEVSLARSVGRLRLIGVARGFTNAFDAGEARAAVGGGAILRLNRTFSLSGDVTTMIDRTSREKVVWGTGLQIQIPGTPHSLSLQASNALTTTLQGASFGTDGVTRYGFEFTIPITLSRFFGGGSPRPVEPPSTDGAAQLTGDTVFVDIRELAFRSGTLEIAPGTTVIWTNRDEVEHSVTADDLIWDSGLIQPGTTWSMKFNRAGAYTYHCTPHRFMTARIVVR